MSGIEVLKAVKKSYPDILVIMITAYEDVPTVVSSMKNGAYEYVVSRLTRIERQFKYPREDVVEVPAIADGLCLSNVFQSHMVIQRDKPVRVWGWASPGEKVTVSFAGQSKSAVAGDENNKRMANSPARFVMAESSKLQPLT